MPDDIQSNKNDKLSEQLDEGRQYQDNSVETLKTAI